MENTDFQNLKSRVEETIGYKLLSPKDFNNVSEQVFRQLNVMISPTTLKRIWGYLHSDNAPRLSTLNILSRFVGYDDWAAFVVATHQEVQNQSNLILQRHLESDELKVGERLQITWLPDRKCILQYRGEHLFEVLESENSTLNVGDTFQCSIFIEGEPLYVDHLHHGSYEDISYVAGKTDGIRFLKC